MQMQKRGQLRNRGGVSGWRRGYIGSYQGYDASRAKMAARLRDGKKSRNGRPLRPGPGCQSTAGPSATPDARDAESAAEDM
jgi:hypothetical protein